MMCERKNLKQLGSVPVYYDLHLRRGAYVKAHQLLKKLFTVVGETLAVS